MQLLHLIIFVLFILNVQSFVNVIQHSSSKFQLNLFNFFNNKKSSEQSIVTTNPIVKTSNPSNNKSIQLEKVSFKQNRNYTLGLFSNIITIQNIKPEPIKIADKQLYSYNYNKINEFPNLYNGWIDTKQDQIFKQFSQSVKNALNDKEKYIEVLFDPVPNLDEVAFGSNWNQLFRKSVSKNLQVPEYVTNRGGPSTLEWSNLYWMNRLSEYLIKSCNKKNVVALSISGEGCNPKAQFPPVFYKNTRLLRLSDESKATSGLLSGTIPCDALIVISPCQEIHYKNAKVLADKLNIPVIALNSPYSYRYDLGAGPPFTLAYIMKRIPKGWIFRQYPKDFEIILEGPDYEISKVYSSSKQLSLVEIAKISMKQSSEKYGDTGNDRIFQNRL